MDAEYMTQKGYDNLTTKKAELEKQLFEAGQDAGEAAGPNCDWHDNPAYDQAQERMRMLAGQIAIVTAHINNAIIIDETTLPEGIPAKVDIGCRVTLEIDWEEETYFIGGSADSDPKNGIISYKTPLAQAIIGGKVGEVKTIQSPSYFKAKILKIERGTS